MNKRKKADTRCVDIRKHFIASSNKCLTTNGVKLKEEGRRNGDYGNNLEYGQSSIQNNYKKLKLTTQTESNSDEVEKSTSSATNNVTEAIKENKDCLLEIENLANFFDDDEDWNTPPEELQLDIKKVDNGFTSQPKKSVDLQNTLTNGSKSITESANNSFGNKENDSMDVENLANFFDDENENWNCTVESTKSIWKRGTVERTEPSGKGIMLWLNENSKNEVSTTIKCLVEGYWSDKKVEVNDVISIKTFYDVSFDLWRVNNFEGCVVKHPDLLISGTTLVGSLFCQRRSVLSHIYPGLDSGSLAMTAGSFIHELLQKVLSKKIYDSNGIKNVAEKLLRKWRMSAQLHQQIDEILPSIEEFINTYILGREKTSKSWPGKIGEILSIEENFWIPTLGIKGKTDFIVETNVNDIKRIMPLELKTGRATNSVEHRGQIVLYLSMLSETGLETKSGLLLYLKQNMMNEIKPNDSEMRGLISVRNNLVDYLMANMKIDESSSVNFVPKLPDPINHRFACSKCPYLNLCSKFLNDDPQTVISSDNPLNQLKNACLTHLTSKHIDYIFKWINLQRLEDSVANKMIKISDIWNVTPEKRQKRGYCISTMKLSEVLEVGSRYIHKMVYQGDESFDLTTSGLLENDYVIVSTPVRYGIVIGYVHSISNHELCLKAERKLDISSPTLYSLDKYSGSDTLYRFNVSNLLSLMDDTESAARLRRLVIDQEIPAFEPTPSFDSLSDDAISLIKHLNAHQKDAVMKCLATKEYLLIRGLPGTGKTATIISLVRLLVKLKYSVLITSHTHSAVDNILVNLRNKVDFLRLGNSSKLSSDLKSHTEEHIIEQYDVKTSEQLEQLYNSFPVIGVTCMGCLHPLISKRTFDFCIVDEATQVLQPSILKCLSASTRFVLVGDPDQLPPVVQNRKVSQLGFDESLFKRLMHPDVTVSLRIQYRMNSQIMQLANSFTYDNCLECQEEDVRTATIDQINCPAEILQKRLWLESSLSNDISKSVLLLNTSKLEPVNSENKYMNHLEANVALRIIELLIKQIPDIGVVTPFREQVKLLKKMTGMRQYSVEVNTVDQYQGRDKDVIIFSSTVYDNPNDAGILSDKRRLNVAITRAKKKLIIIGNVDVLITFEEFNRLINFIPKDNIIDVVF